MSALPQENSVAPAERVREVFALPITPRAYQEAEINFLAQFERSGNYGEPGCGKTLMATYQALYWCLHGTEQWVVLMPPILIDQWARWLGSITDMRTGKRLTVASYRGEPKERREIDLNAQFILMGYQIFKKDFDHLYETFAGRDVGLMADEAHAVKNIESDNHKALDMFSAGRPLVLLTGTPVNKPGDSYAYIKLIARKLYRNRRHFERLHVKEKDERDNPTEWQNLDVLANNMKVQTSRILRRDVRKELPPVQFDPKPYRLDPRHIKLYRRIAAERLVEFGDNNYVDAISASALRTALQQVVVNWPEFDGDPNLRPAVLDLIDETMEELDGRKLVVVANFRRTNAYLLQALAQYNPVAIYGDVSMAAKLAAIDRFVQDPDCRIIQLQPASGGVGIDGLQHVCRDMLFVEAPTTPMPFWQTVARLDREGQKDSVHCRIATALGTVQVDMFKDLLENDEVANEVQGGYKDLKELVYGGE